ncbi:unnamed protein product [Ectocarpus sp. 6 AP-2014]
MGLSWQSAHTLERPCRCHSFSRWLLQPTTDTDQAIQSQAWTKHFTLGVIVMYLAKLSLPRTSGSTISTTEEENHPCPLPRPGRPRYPNTNQAVAPS